MTGCENGSVMAVSRPNIPSGSERHGSGGAHHAVPRPASGSPGTSADSQAIEAAAAEGDGSPAPRYRLHRKIGIGGMAEVFEATLCGAQGFERRVAVKRVLPCYSESSDFASMFAEEARLAAGLSHPNVVSVIDFDRGADGRFFLAMEYVDGISLAELAARGPVPFDVAAYVTLELLVGLGYIHELPGPTGARGLVHRDVSPQNVLLSREGAVKIADFGVAKAMDGASASASIFPKGKASYASSEQLNGEPLDARSDLFAVGVLLWELLASRRLFEGSPGEIVTQVLFREIPRPSVFRRAIPSYLEIVAMRLLSRKPAERYPSAALAHDRLARSVHAPRAARVKLAQLVAERAATSDGDGPGGCPGRGGPPIGRPARRAPRTRTDASAEPLANVAAGGIAGSPSVSTPKKPAALAFDDYLELVEAMERTSRHRSRNIALLQLLFHVRLRPAALSALDVKDIDFETRALTIAKVQKGRSRLVPFNDLVSQALEGYLTERQTLVGLHEPQALFLSGDSKRLSPESVRALMHMRYG